MHWCLHWQAPNFIKWPVAFYHHKPFSQTFIKLAIITEQQQGNPCTQFQRCRVKSSYVFEVIGAGHVPGLYGMQHMIYVWCKAAQGWNDLLVLIGCSWEFQPAETYIDTKELSLSFWSCCSVVHVFCTCQKCVNVWIVLFSINGCIRWWVHFSNSLQM